MSIRENAIDLEGIHFTGAVAIDSLTDASNKHAQLCGVIVRDHGTVRVPPAHDVSSAQNEVALVYEDD